jgi:hypothetical protein
VKEGNGIVSHRFGKIHHFHVFQVSNINSKKGSCQAAHEKKEEV